MADIPIGAAIRNVRLNRNITHDQFIRSMGCPRTYISKIENGRCCPGIENLVRIADALKIEPWKLLRYAIRLQRELEA